MQYFITFNATADDYNLVLLQFLQKKNFSPDLIINNK